MKGGSVLFQAVLLLFVLGGWSGARVLQARQGAQRTARPACRGSRCWAILGARDAGGQRRCFCFLAACWGGATHGRGCGAGRPAGARAGGPGGAGAWRCRGVRGLGDDAPGGRRQHLCEDVKEEGEQEREGNLGPATWAAGMRCKG
jgi:hypothetical protein